MARFRYVALDRAGKTVSGELAAEQIDERRFTDTLASREVPDPDLLIRTAGEQRLSNFLLWQIAYAEIWITPVFWPDFRRKHFLEALVDYQKRERRFGALHGSDPQSP